MALIDLDDLCDDAVEKIAVMGYDENASRIIQKIRFQPGDGGHVQMVGGLVQKNDVGPGKQQPAQIHTGLLPSGEGGNLFSEILLGKTEALQYADDLTFPGVTVGLFKFMAGPCVGVHKTGKLFAVGMLHGGLQLSQSLFQVNDILLDLQKSVVNGLIRRAFLVLGQISQSFIFGKDNRAAVGRKLPGDDLQNGGFSSSVDADNGSLFPVFYMKGAVFDDGNVSEGFADLMAG